LPPADQTPPERGDVFRVNLQGDGHVLAGSHFAVVVSDQTFNRLSTVVVVPFSSGASLARFRPEVVIRGTRTRALVEQIHVVDRRRLLEYIDSLAGTAVMDEIDERLRDLLGLEE
jgi:mRNA interferase MazF